MHEILSNETIAAHTYEMQLGGDTRAIKRPGRFINIKLPGFYLRRPISISHWDETSMTIVYKVVGQGTEALSRMKAGESLDLLYPLGNGYRISPATGWENIAVVGGGVGIPPLYGLVRALLAHGIRPLVILGFQRKEEMFYLDKFRSLGVEVQVTTADGSYGTKGLVTDVMSPCAYVYACGPEAMLQAVSQKATHGQFSFEARMACGFGGCMGCTCKTKDGWKRICKEGPILEKEELPW